VPARNRAPASPGRREGSAVPARVGSSPRGTARRSSAPGPRVRLDRGDAPPGTETLVVGHVPLLARLAGVLLALAGVLAGVAAFPTYLVVGGVAVSPVTGPVDALVALVAPAATVLVGAVLALGRVPRLGLAYAAVAGALAVGRLLIELYQGHGSTTRPAVEVLAGERVLTSTVQTGPGWMLGLTALAGTVVAGGLALAAWNRTVMEDGGSLDPRRPALAGMAALAGVGAVLCLALPAADVPDRIVTDPTTGLETVVTAEGPQALLERPGLALLGGLLLAGAVVLCAVVAPSLRPRLAAVGGLLGVTVFLVAGALTGARDAAHSPDVDWTVPGIGLLVLAVAFAGLTVLAWRWHRPPAAPRAR
jgi:iron complex transport system permease protein